VSPGQLGALVTAGLVFGVAAVGAMTVVLSANDPPRVELIELREPPRPIARMSGASVSNAGSEPSGESGSSARFIAAPGRRR
jgi:hypothetical protein